MFCKNCGAQIPDGGKFCTKCGWKVEQETPVQEAPVQPVVEPQAPVQPEVQPQPQPQATYEYAQPQPQQAPAKKPLNKKLIIILASALLALILVIVAVVVVVKHNNKKIDVNKYIEVKFDGYDGYGTARVDFDEDAFMKAALKAGGKKVAKTSNKDMNDLMDLFSSYTSQYSGMYELEDSIEIELSEDEELSNGDKVKVTITTDKDVAKENKVILKSKDFSVEVSGLKDTEKVNPFDDIKIEASGVSPYVYLSCDNTAYSSIYYDIEDNGNLKAGDTIEINVSDSCINYLVYDGIKLTETSMEYTIDNVDRYIESVDDLSKDAIKDMQKEAEVCISDYSSDYDSDITISDIEYKGIIFANTDGNNYWDNNMAFVVYTYTVASVDNKFETQTIYAAVKISDILEKANGDVTMSSSYYVEEDTDLLRAEGWFGDYYVEGFKTIDDLNKYVDKEFEDYIVTRTSELK